MGKKYIIELKDRETLYKAAIKNGEPYVTIALGKPYTEFDLEQIRREAYEKGQKDLRESCVPKDEEAYGIGYHEGFQCGLDLAWNAAKKIENLSEAEKFEIFGEYDMFHIMRCYTASEAIEKIRQYEQTQKKLEREKEEKKPISTEEAMRQYLDKFCKSQRCRYCVLNTDDFTCGRGYYFTTADSPVSDEEVRRAYAEIMKK